jgi:hypothetical protein
MPTHHRTSSSMPSNIGQPTANGGGNALLPTAPAATDDSVELRDFLSAGPPDAPPPDVMQLAMHGDLCRLRELVERGAVDPKFQDEEGITPLHVGSSAFVGSLYGEYMLTIL